MEKASGRRAEAARNDERVIAAARQVLSADPEAPMAAIAAAAGVLMALLLRYNGPDATLSFDIMIAILLMVVIGGMGTLYGPALGAVIIVMAQYYLQSLMGAASEALSGVPVLPALFHPDRWLLWLGVLFVLIVYFFPLGIVGRLRKGSAA
jgi:branched-chain amino acid transport system permease protein